MTKAGEPPLRTYFLECFAPATTEAAVAQDGRRGKLAASRITRSGRHAAYVGTHLVARDEIVIHVVRCADERTAAEVGRAAGWPVERVVETVFIDRS